MEGDTCRRCATTNDKRRIQIQNQLSHVKPIDRQVINVIDASELTLSNAIIYASE